MHSPQLITQSLNVITPKANNMVAAENKPATNFNTVLNKEVNNQNKNLAKPNNNNDGNKAKLNKQNETVASPPKQEASKIDKANNAEKKAIDESDTSSEAVANTADEANTLLAFVDQLNQLGLQAQANVASSDDTVSIAGNDIADSASASTLASTDLNSKLRLHKDSTQLEPANSQSDGEASDFSTITTAVQALADAKQTPRDIEPTDKLNTAQPADMNASKDTAIDTKRRFADTVTTGESALLQAQQQATSNGLAQIVANAEQTASEKTGITSIQSAAEVTTDTEKSNTTKLTGARDKLDGSKQIRDAQTEIATRDGVANKFELHKEKLTEGTHASTLSDNNAEQNNAVSSLQNQTPPSETTKLNETVKSQVMSDHISPRVGTKAWDQAIGQKVVWMVAGGEQSAELSLNPPDLGPLQVVLSISDNQVDASFVSSHLDVREAIEAAAPKLKEMMDNAGISLSGFSVNAEAKSSNSQFSDQQNSRDRSLNTRQTDSLTTPIERSVASQAKRVQLGAVDTFV